MEANSELFKSTSRQLSHLSHRDKPPFYRSTSNLSPVVEGNETEGDATGTSGRSKPSESVRVIATSVSPSKTFQMLTRGGIFEDLGDLWTTSAGDDGWGGFQEGGEISNLMRHRTDRFAENITMDRNDDILNAIPKSPLSSEMTSTTVQGVGNNRVAGASSLSLSNTRVPLTRPKKRNNTLDQTKPVLAGDSTDKKKVPEQSVEQDVHRERINSLLRPSQNKTVLRKISPPSVPANNGHASRKLSPPDATSNVRTQSHFQFPLTGKSPAQITNSQPKLFTPRTVPPGRKLNPSSGLLSGASRKISPPSSALTHDDPKLFSQRYRRKSLPDIRVVSTIESSTTGYKVPSRDGLNSSSKQTPSPRRKISEPCLSPSFLPNSTNSSRQGFSDLH